MSKNQHNTSENELDKALDQLSELNMLVAKSDHCAVCGISPSKLKEFITSYAKQREWRARAKNSGRRSKGCTGVLSNKHIKEHEEV